MTWTRREMVWQSVWRQATFILPGLFAFVGFGALLDRELLFGVTWFAAALVSYALCLWLFTKAMDWTPHALTVGELRDRIFALAEKAGVKMKQVYVLPAGKGRLANAFAVRNDIVTLTDYLLQRLSKREVDAVVAHELAHLKRGHAKSLRITFWLTTIGVGVLVGALGDILKSEAWMSALVVLLPLAILSVYLLSRHFERSADADAVALTGDAEALITALAKITRLNLLPMQWGKWDERLLTHPSTLRRVQAIAQRSGTSLERLQEILSAADTDANRYELPPALASEEKVFSTTFKHNTVFHMAWAVIAVMVVTPPLVAYTVRWAGWKSWTVCPLGLMVTIAIYMTVVNVMSVWGYRDLQRRLRAKLEREGVRFNEGSVFVGFAPASSPRLFEYFYDWDVGFLSFDGDGLRYVGEQTRFALRREQICDVRLGQGPPGWLRSPRVYVTWHDEERGAGGTFYMRPVYVSSLWQLRREVPRLFQRLRAWREETPAPTLPPASLPPLPPPDIGTVTSYSPSEFITLRALLSDVLIKLLLSGGFCALLQLPFTGSAGSLGGLAVLTTLLVSIFGWLPYLTFRDPDRSPKKP